MLPFSYQLADRGCEWPFGACKRTVFELGSFVLHSGDQDLDQVPDPRA